MATDLLPRELQPDPGQSKLLAGDTERGDRSVESGIDGIDLRTLNVTTAVALGIQVGEAAIRQILRGGSGPLGERKDC